MVNSLPFKIPVSRQNVFIYRPTCREAQDKPIPLLSDLGQEGFEEVLCAAFRVRAGPPWWSLVPCEHSELVFLDLLMERGRILPHSHVDTKIMKLKVQVKYTSCKLSTFWMLRWIGGFLCACLFLGSKGRNLPGVSSATPSKNW